MEDSTQSEPREAEASLDGFVVTDAKTANRLLREQSIGIIGLAGGAGGAPEQRPVNYAVYRSWILMRTDRGILFEAARAGNAASLAVTSFDPESRTAWSVIVKGRLEIGDPGIDASQLAVWAHTGKAERIRLSIDEISGRHLIERKHD